MTAIRRVAPLSLTLSLVLFAGAASASPAVVKGESAIKSFGVAVATGVSAGSAEYRARRIEAGPGLIKRTLMRVGQFLAADWKQTKADAKAVKTAIADDWQQTKADAKAVKAAIADDWKQTKADAKAVGAAFEAAPAKIATAGTQAAFTTGVVVSAGKGKIARAIDKLNAWRARGKALRAANRDIEKFFNEKGNEDLRTVLVGAKKESGLGISRFVRGASIAAAGAQVAAGAITGNPAHFALGGAYTGVAMVSHQGVKQDRREAYTKAVVDALNRPGNRVDSARLASWVQAGAIDDFSK